MLDGDCAIEKSFYGGGSAGTSAYNACISSHQIERIEQIKYYLCPDYSMKGDCLLRLSSDNIKIILSRNWNDYDLQR